MAMRSSGDLFPRAVTSVDELLAIAHALACEAEARYRSLAERRRLSGDLELTHLFERLAENAGRHMAQVVQRSQSLRGHAPDPALVRQQLPRQFNEETMHSALLTPYQALANAVVDEERTFAFHTYLAAQAQEGPMRRLAEAFAAEKLDHAALLRPERRRAFHARRPRTASLPRTVAELHALASEWDALAARMHAELARRLADAGDLRNAEIFRRLAEDEAQGNADGLAERRTAGAETTAAGVRILEQAFERYADIAARAGSESLMAAAQRLTERTLRRLILARSAREDVPALIP